MTAEDVIEKFCGMGISLAPTVHGGFRTCEWPPRRVTEALVGEGTTQFALLHPVMVRKLVDSDDDAEVLVGALGPATEYTLYLSHVPGRLHRRAMALHDRLTRHAFGTGVV